MNNNHSSLYDVPPTSFGHYVAIFREISNTKCNYARFCYRCEYV